jgi:hypothetical protein
MERSGHKAGYCVSLRVTWCQCGFQCERARGRVQESPYLSVGLSDVCNCFSFDPAPVQYCPEVKFSCYRAGSCRGGTDVLVMTS